jgi:signal peptidase II
LPGLATGTQNKNSKQMHMEALEGKTDLKIQQKNGRSPRGYFVFLFVILIVLDQLAKYLASNIFKNYKFAFSLPVPVWLMYPVYFLVVALIVWHVVKYRNSFAWNSALAWTLILAGAAANIIERIILGYVRDFVYISLSRWTGIYNIADGYIIVGIIILLITYNKNSKFQIPNSK